MSQRSRKISTARVALVGTLLFSALVPRAAGAQTWPADAAWRALDCGLVPSFDPRRDEPGAVDERDVVGDEDAPAVYLASDATHVFFRMRVDGAPAVAGDFARRGWGVAIDTNLDRLNYELLAMVDGTARTDSVRLAENTVFARPGDPSDTAERTIATYAGAENARALLSEGDFGSSFGGNPDYFVDWAIARSDLTMVGVSATTPLALVFGTSTAGAALEADLACHVTGADDRTFARASSDPVTLVGDVPDSDGDGLADSEEDERGTDAMDADSDGDGYADGIEVREGTDPQDADSVPTNLKIRGGGGFAGGCSLQPLSRVPWPSVLAVGAWVWAVSRRRKWRC